MTDLADEAIASFPVRPEIITEEFISVLRRAGVIWAYLFGSVARREERVESDIDLLVRFGGPFRLTDQLDLIVKLWRITGRNVDVLTEIDPAFEPYIVPTLVRIPL